MHQSSKQQKNFLLADSPPSHTLQQHEQIGLHHPHPAASQQGKQPTSQRLRQHLPHLAPQSQFPHVQSSQHSGSQHRAPPQHSMSHAQLLQHPVQQESKQFRHEPQMQSTQPAQHCRGQVIHATTQSEHAEQQLAQLTQQPARHLRGTTARINSFSSDKGRAVRLAQSGCARLTMVCRGTSRSTRRT